MELFVDGHSASFSYCMVRPLCDITLTWDASHAAVGSHTLRVLFTTSLGKTAQSPLVHVTVAAPPVFAAPTVHIDSPADGVDRHWDCTRPMSRRQLIPADERPSRVDQALPRRRARQHRRLPHVCQHLRHEPPLRRLGPGRHAHAAGPDDHPRRCHRLQPDRHHHGRQPAADGGPDESGGRCHGQWRPRHGLRAGDHRSTADVRLPLLHRLGRRRDHGGQPTLRHSLADDLLGGPGLEYGDNCSWSAQPRRRDDHDQGQGRRQPGRRRQPGAGSAAAAGGDGAHPGAAWHLPPRRRGHREGNPDPQQQTVRRSPARQWP